jgi:hypothetical protein
LFTIIHHSNYSVFDVNLRQPYYTKENLIELMKASDFIKLNDERISLSDEQANYIMNVLYSVQCRQEDPGEQKNYEDWLNAEGKKLFEELLKNIVGNRLEEESFFKTLFSLIEISKNETKGFDLKNIAKMINLFFK